MSTVVADRPARVWQDVHERADVPWPRWVPVVDEVGARRRFAWSVPGLVIAAPVVIIECSVAEVARAVVAAARAGGAIGVWRERLAVGVHELGAGRASEVVAGAWPPDVVVVRRVAVTVTLARERVRVGSPWGRVGKRRPEAAR